MSSLLVANFLQILVVLLFSPLLKGVTGRLKGVVQSRHGPSIWQPYFDLYKLCRKDEVISEDASWIFRAAPLVSFAVPLLVTVLIPVLTAFPLTWAFMGDMLGGGFILSLGGFFATLAAMDTASPYGQMGSSRTRMVSFLAEPVLMCVFFVVSLVAGSTIPYVVNKAWYLGGKDVIYPSHVLVIIAFFMVILAETGRIPVDNPEGHFELAMIDESKSLEYSGKAFALVKWGGYMKLFVLLTIFMNVLITPLGLAGAVTPVALLLAVGSLLLKMLAGAIVIVVIESSLAKLRLFRVGEFLGAAFVVSLLGLVTFFIGV
ncbi:MAG TPA: NADH-quinone oxidoreductase subunit H [Spirochaetia bacterium]|nr:NADH-quinone oxidoreductase subunit H [Spirochaetia bacterium]